MQNNEIRKPYTTINAYKTYFLVFVMMLIFSTLLAMITVILAGTFGITLEELQNNTIFTYCQYLLSPIMFLLIFVIVNRKKEYNTMEMLGVKNKVKPLHILLSIGMSVFAIVFFSQFASMFDLLLEKINFNPSDDLNVNNNTVGYLLLNTLVIAIMPAVFEELIFRGIIFKSLEKEHTPTTAILLSALMFSLMHGSLQQTVFQFILGVVLGYVMYATGNIIYPMITHFFNNFLIIFIDLMSKSGVVDAGQTTPTGVLPYIIATILAVIGTVCLIFIIRASIKAKQKTTEVGVYKNFKTYSVDEKRYVYWSFGLCIAIWIINTISMFGGN